MRFPWQRRIDRATELARRDDAARAVLGQYARLLALQRDADAGLRTGAIELTGILERDLPVVRTLVPVMLTAIAAEGPPDLARDAAQTLEDGDSAIDALLLDGWRTPSGSFFAKLALQPYAERLVELGRSLSNRRLPAAHAACPCCGGPPQLALLTSAGDADGGGRQLLCAMCATSWPFRRVLCPSCGEEEERRLGYFHAADFDHVRVDACDTCRRYLKTIDLTRLGIAVPLVDEVASGALDLWAQERGYTKVTPNLIGL